uniref:FAD-binding oxidoreductase n=1 Tax=Eiseniibacteriota bacterium TaxID=2212470 RepID=A0A832I134_UNCEI
MTSPSGPARSPWLDEPGLALPPLEGRAEADLAIVGGGITGVTLAWTLVEEGASVVLLEAGEVAGGASGRNAGFLLAAPAEPYVEQVDFWGREGARAMLETGRRNHRRIKALVEQLGLDCEYRRSGSVRLTRTAEEAEEHRGSIPLMKADGFPMVEDDPARFVPASAAGAFTAAFVMPEDGEIHPVRFIHGVARAACARGARLHEGSRVVSGQWADGAWTVRTASGEVRARTLVVATNAWGPELLPGLAPLVVSRRGQMLATAPLPRRVTDLPTYAHYGYHYWRQLPDGRLVIGGWRDLDPDGEVGFGLETTGPIQRAIEGGLAQLVPEGAPIERRWSGTMGFARDGRPLVGWLDPQHHLAVCLGFTGHGMGMAAACTLDLAALLAWKDAPGIRTFDPARFAELRQRQGVTVLGAAR